MRRWLPLCVLHLIVWMLACQPSWAVNEPPFSWIVSKTEVAGEGDSLRVSLSFVFRGSVAPKEAVILSPVVTNGDYDITMQPIAVKGRKLVLSSVSGNAEEISVSSEEGGLDYTYVFPRRDWMDSCRVAVVHSTYSRKEGIRFLSRRSCGIYMRPKEPAVALPWNFREPQADDSGLRAVSFPMGLSFDGKAREVKESLGGNAERIEEFDALVRPFFLKDSPAVVSATLEAYTSPSGNEKSNQSVTGSRLQALQKLLQKRGTFGKSKPALSAKGEDWEGLVRWVREGGRGDDDRLQEIVALNAPLDSLEGLLRREKPVAWEELEDRCFPDMERFVCRIEYTPRQYQSRDAVLEAYGVSPYFLSARDLWVVVSAFPAGSAEWCDALLTAVSVFPDDEATRTNAALGLTELGYLPEASVWLRDCGDFPEAVLARAIWLYRKGMYEDCVPLFESLKGKGGSYDVCWKSIDAWWKWYNRRVKWEPFVY